MPALGQGVVDLPCHPLPLVEHPGLAGLDQQLGVQARVLLQRRLDLGVGLVQLDERLLLPLVALVGHLDEVGGPPGQHRADQADGEPRPPEAAGDRGNPAQVRHRHDHGGGGGAGIPPPASQIEERLGIADEGEQAVPGCGRHQASGQHHEHRVIQAHQRGVPVPSRVEGVEPQQPDRGRDREPERRREVRRHVPERQQQGDEGAHRQKEVRQDLQGRCLLALPAVELGTQLGLDAHDLLPAEVSGGRPTGRDRPPRLTATGRTCGR
jgi:hypothetical protein